MSNPTTPSAVLADDERLMREQLRTRLAEVWPELTIVAEAKNGAEAVELVAQHRPNVVFLDIRMPGMTGIEAAAGIAQLDGSLPEVVFVTAYDQYAVEAFERGAVDYVLKPAQADRLSATAQRVQARLAQRGGSASQPDMSALIAQLKASISASLGVATPEQPERLRYIQATIGQQLRMIPIEDVLFFVSDEKYTRVQTAANEALIRKPIKELLDELDPAKFWQIHRSTIVNVAKIAGVVNDERGHKIISMQGISEKLEVSRTYVHLFKQM